jgi:hypothetical protein
VNRNFFIGDTDGKLLAMAPYKSFTESGGIISPKSWQDDSRNTP